MTASSTVALRSRVRGNGMRLTGDQIVRAAALAAVLVVAIVVALLLLRRPGGDYVVKARFQNAAQLVKGNLVQTGGAPIGTVETIDLTDDGQAEVTLKLEDGLRPAAPRHAGHDPPGLAVRRRQPLRRPADGAPERREDPRRRRDRAGLDDHGRRPRPALQHLRPRRRARRSQGVIRGSAAQIKGKGKEFNEGIAYLNPSLAASSRLFRELNRDTPLLERFIVSSSQLVTDIADRRDDLAGLVDELATTTTAIGNQNEALAESIGRLPGFQRRANTTFVNLRAALDDLDPLVEESKPVAKKLRPFLAELRPLARDARPTINDLSEIVKRARRRQRPDRADEPAGAAARRHHAQVRRQRQGARRRVRGLARTRSRATRPSSRSSAPTRPTCSAGSTTSATPASTTRSAPPRASASTPTPFALTGAGGAGQYELIPPELRDEALQRDARDGPEQPLPGRRRAQDRRRLRALQADPRLPLRPVAGAPGRLRCDASSPSPSCSPPRPPTCSPRAARRRSRAARSRSSSTTRSGSSRAAT